MGHLSSSPITSEDAEGEYSPHSTSLKVIGVVCGTLVSLSGLPMPATCQGVGNSPDPHSPAACQGLRSSVY